MKSPTRFFAFPFSSFLFILSACPGDVPSDAGPVDDAGLPAAYVDADAVRGGALYDKWWSAADVAEPTDDHPLWAERPDTVTNTRTGSTTWRCKECHGWDYRGVDGAYATGSHVTGIAGVLGSALDAQATYDLLDGDHSYGSTALSEEDLWDLTKFTLEGLIDTTPLISGDAFTGTAADGETHFTAQCAGCHGDDGLATPPDGAADFDAFVGTISNDNPSEFLHKLRHGQPGSAMPPQVGILTLDEMNDLSAFAQTLPLVP